MNLSHRLPDFPWDSLIPARVSAARHPGGVVDLSIGTPVDPTPAIAQDALRAASNSPGYPTVWGTAELHEAIIGYLTSRWRATGLVEQQVMPAIGTKELVGWLPTLLGIGPDDLVVIPTTAYPTYEVGAAMVGARIQRCDDPAEIDGRPKLIWINSPANPHGVIASAPEVQAWVEAGRDHGAVLASDECYGEFGWDAEPTSILDSSIVGNDHTGLLAVHSTSKRSNMAGYRAGFVAGDVAVVSELIALRKHLGMMVPLPVQAAMAAVLGDHGHVEAQRSLYLARRRTLKKALEGAGFRIDHSEGSLYPWATRGENCRVSVDWLAERGIVVAPGDFYGPAGEQHVRVALTATDERVAAAAERLA